MSIGVIVGRFQTHKLTEAHKTLIVTALKENNSVLVVIGTTPAINTQRDPLDYMDRAQHIIAEFSDSPVIVTNVKDNRSNKVWVDNLDKLLDYYREHQKDDLILYGGPDSFLDIYLAFGGKYPTVRIGEVAGGHATSSRFNIDQRFTEDFRAGKIHGAMSRYVSVFPVVDVLVLRDTSALLARKPDENLYRFVGGFVDPSDKSYEMAVSREVLEETGLEVGYLRYCGSCMVPDWRYRGPEHIMSACFIADFVFGFPQPKDDICELKWVNLGDVENMLIPEHKGLFLLVQRKLNNESITPDR